MLGKSSQSEFQYASVGLMVASAVMVYTQRGDLDLVLVDLGKDLVLVVVSAFQSLFRSLFPESTFHDV